MSFGLIVFLVIATLYFLFTATGIIGYLSSIANSLETIAKVNSAYYGEDEKSIGETENLVAPPKPKDSKQSVTPPKEN
jgi:hypothetical protein